MTTQTNHCSRCGNTGHNKRTCAAPDTFQFAVGSRVTKSDRAVRGYNGVMLIGDVVKVYDLKNDIDGPHIDIQWDDNGYVSCQFRSYELALIVPRQAPRTITCSKCHTQGHNRRSCTVGDFVGTAEFTVGSRVTNVHLTTAGVVLEVFDSVVANDVTYLVQWDHQSNPVIRFGWVLFAEREAVVAATEEEVAPTAPVFSVGDRVTNTSLTAAGIVLEVYGSETNGEDNDSYLVDWDMGRNGATIHLGRNLLSDPSANVVVAEETRTPIVSIETNGVQWTAQQNMVSYDSSGSVTTANMDSITLQLDGLTMSTTHAATNYLPPVVSAAVVKPSSSVVQVVDSMPSRPPTATSLEEIIADANDAVPAVSLISTGITNQVTTSTFWDSIRCQTATSHQEVEDSSVLRNERTRRFLKGNKGFLKRIYDLRHGSSLDRLVETTDPCWAKFTDERRSSEIMVQYQDIVISTHWSDEHQEQVGWSPWHQSMVKLGYRSTPPEIINDDGTTSPIPSR